MAAEIEKRFGFSTQLVKGKNGVFEVSLDDDLVFSKKSLGRFPEPEEVESTLEQRLA